ncbi:hypothetical protein FQN54_004823 [Arachnomyces sp. PD_36]|nr:hypothetical protein FQN54_004823 [Arachnomyces sp. PD_36]
MATTTSTRARAKRGKESAPKPSTKTSGPRTAQRVTRSQSRGGEDGWETDPQDGTELARGRQPSVELGSAKQQSGAETVKNGGIKRRKRARSPTSELPTVSEEPTRKSPRRDSLAQVSKGSDGNQLGPETVDDHANISGTTILANDSFDAPESLDAPFMLEVLPQLFSASTSLLKFIIPPESSEKKLSDWILHLQQGKMTTRLSHQMSVFESHQKCFNSHTYIDISSVVRAFSSNPDEVQRQNPGLERILHKANLAALASYMVRFTDRQSSRKYFLDLQSRFPQGFMRLVGKETREQSPNPQEELEELRRNFKLLLDIRTQCLISSLEPPNAEDSLDTSVSQVDAGLALPADCSDRELIKKWVISHLRDSGYPLLPRELKGDIRQRETEVRRIVYEEKGKHESVVNRLQETFPFQPFITQLAAWVRSRVETVNREMELEGTTEDLVDRLQEELDRQKSNPQPSEPLSPERQLANDLANEDTAVEMAPPENPVKASDSRVSGPPENWTMLNPSALRRLKLLENKEGEPAEEVEPQPTEQDTRRGATSPISTCSEAETEKQPSAQNDTHRPDQKERQNKGLAITRKAGPAFIDPQEDAQRVSPIALEDSARRKNPRKRQPVPSDVEESEDGSESEAYQQDSREVDVSQNRKNKPRGPPPPKKRRTSAGNLPNEPEEQPQNNHRRREDKSPDRRSALSYSPGDSEPERSRSQERSNREQSGPITTRLKSEEQAKPQQRRRWTDDETRRLVKLISKYGTSWAHIQEKDAGYAAKGGEPKLTQRNQVQLKDKARNLVTDYYKTGKKLPPNFDKIPISQRQKDQLAQLGIEYP